MQYLYHGTKEEGIKELKPKEAGHGKEYVYATNEAFAVIFINRPGGSLVADWSFGEDGIPYYVEKVEDVFDKNYSGVSGSLYVLDKSLFFHDESMDKIEFASSEVVPVIEEIKIQDLKEYLLNLEREGKLNIIKYKDRLRFFPKIDDDSVKDALELVEKYGKDRILESIKVYRPDIFDEVLEKLESGELRKILIIGDAGRGKSTLAFRLSEKLGIEHYSTDDFYWKTKFTEKRDPSESLPMVLEVYKKDEWIVEGATAKLFTPGLETADLVVRLVYPNIFAQSWRLFKRELGRDNTNIFQFLLLLRHIVYLKYGWGYKRGEPAVRDILNPYISKVVVLSSFKEIDKFVEGL